MAEVGTVAEAIEEVKGRFNPVAARGMSAVYQFELRGAGGGKYYFVINDGTLEIREGEHESPNITVSMSGADYVAMTKGTLNPQVAFMNGKLRIAGDMGLAMKMQALFPPVA